MSQLRIVVMGTRGKSSIVRWLHRLFYQNNKNVLSRETGLIPFLRYNGAHKLIQRQEREDPFGRAGEAKVIMELYRDSPVDALIFENNGVEAHAMSNLNRYLKPDLVIITTTSLDHLEQGWDSGEIATTFLDSIHRSSQIIFWTSHSFEKETFDAACRRRRLKPLASLRGDLPQRESQIFPSVQAVAARHGITLEPFYIPSESIVVPPEDLAELPNGRLFINCGDINDPLHTHLLLDQIISEGPERPLLLLFNLRADREGRLWMFARHFVKAFKNRLYGIILLSEHLAFSPQYLASYYRRLLKHSHDIALLTCGGFDDFRFRMVDHLPPDCLVVMIGNTTNEFGYQVIDYYRLLHATYPELMMLNLEDWGDKPIWSPRTRTPG